MGAFFAVRKNVGSSGRSMRQVYADLRSIEDPISVSGRRRWSGVATE